MSLRALADRYRAVRARTLDLCAPLSAEDMVVQSMPDASPAKWHLAHTTWFFETMVLKAAAPERAPFHPAFAVLFNSYYNSIGAQHPRPARGLLTRPPLADVLAYRSAIDEHMVALLEGPPGPVAALAPTVVLGLNHEEQHQELLLTDVKHLFAQNPTCPVYRPRQDAARGTGAGVAVAPARWIAFDEGLRWIGFERPAGMDAAAAFAFDNESPRHRVFAGAFAIASRPVTCGEFLAFIADGGYRRADLWLSDGWRVVQERGWTAPLYWRRDGERWFAMTLSGLLEIAPAEPVCHVSSFEADAYARWSGARLPTEAEWEIASERAAPGMNGANFADSGRFHPAPCSADDDAPAPSRMFGDVWEWTASAYLPYPGYRAPAGPVGEYNGKFMSGQMVLRGGSCATPRGHVRPTYRNFFPPDARWQFSGIRLARDA